MAKQGFLWHRSNVSVLLALGLGLEQVPNLDLTLMVGCLFVNTLLENVGFQVSCGIICQPRKLPRRVNFPRSLILLLEILLILNILKLKF